MGFKLCLLVWILAFFFALAHADAVPTIALNGITEISNTLVVKHNGTHVLNQS